MLRECLGVQSYLEGHSRCEDMLMRINSQVSRFLVQSRQAFSAVYKAHGIDTEAAPFEALWLCSIVHAVDHVRFPFKLEELMQNKT